MANERAGERANTICCQKRAAGGRDRLGATLWINWPETSRLHMMSPMGEYWPLPAIACRLSHPYHPTSGPVVLPHDPHSPTPTPRQFSTHTHPRPKLLRVRYGERATHKANQPTIHPSIL